MSLNPIIALAAVIKSCSDAKTRVKQNKRLCGHLVDVIEALDPVLETVKNNERGHEPTLKKLLEVVEDAEALLERQTRRRSFVLRMCTSTSAALEFDNINTRLAALTGTLTLSQSALSNAMLSSLSPRGDYKDPGEHPAHASTTPSPTPPKSKGNTRTDRGMPWELHEGDVKVLLSWRARSDVLAKLWPVDENPFSWKGVSFEEGRVTNLLLSETQLSGSIPKGLGQLSALTKLWLNNNQLSGSIPKGLGQLSALTELQLYGNQMSGRIPKGLGRLSALKDLKLHENKLSGSIPKEIGQLSALTSLWLNGNQLSGSIPKELGQLSALTELQLYGNQLSGSIPKELGQLSALTELKLNNNLLSGSIPKELGQLSAITQLDLSGNQLSGSIPKGLGQLSALTDLCLSENQKFCVALGFRAL